MAKAKKLSLATLQSLLGKQVDDPTVLEVLARDKVKIGKEYVESKHGGFDFALERVEGKKKKVLHTLFVSESLGEVPSGFSFTDRATLLASLPPPKQTWKIGKGNVPVDTKGVDHDTWDVDGYEVCVGYRDTGKVNAINIALSEDALGGGSLETHPLHFETKPADAPKHAELVGMALLVAWAADRHGLPPKHASTELGKQLAKRAITPRTFLQNACGGTLTTLDVAPKVGAFLSTYTHNTYASDDGERKPTDAKIQKLLKLKRPDECRYTDDFTGTFADVVENPFHVPDSWDAVDRIAPVIDARLADFEATGFQTAPDLKPYEKAAKLRDGVEVKPDVARLAKATVDDALAEELVGLIGKPLTDKHVKAVLTRAGLPVGKKIDQQANPALGVSYMGAKLDIDGKKALGIEEVGFYASKYKSYIRGIGAEVEFLAYDGMLPKGVKIGDSRDAVAKKLGKPAKSSDERDWWSPSKTRKIMCEFKNDKLVHISFGIPTGY